MESEGESTMTYAITNKGEENITAKIRKTILNVSCAGVEIHGSEIVKPDGVKEEPNVVGPKTNPVQDKKEVG